MSDMIRELGLKVYRATYTSNTYCIVPSYKDADMILVSDLRAALDKLPVVYGLDGIKWSETKNRFAEDDTHTAKIIGVEKIVRESLKWSCEQKIVCGRFEIPYDFEGKRVKVVVTEIQEGE